MNGVRVGTPGAVSKRGTAAVDGAGDLGSGDDDDPVLLSPVKDVTALAGLIELRKRC